MTLAELMLEAIPDKERPILLMRMDFLWCIICAPILHFSVHNRTDCPESYENLQTAFANDREKKEEANQCSVPIQQQEIFHKW